MYTLSLPFSLSFTIIQRLREFKVNVKEFSDANDDANKLKNRNVNALPCELPCQSLVVLL